MAILAYQKPVYAPAMRIVTNITNAFPALVTTSFDNGYITGLIVRIDMPLGYGMQQINGQIGEITVVSSTTFTITIDTTNYNAFSTPTGYTQMAQYCQVVPVGENNSILTGAVVNQLPY